MAKKIKRNGFLALRTATKQVLALGGLILLHLSLGHMNSKIWFWMAPALIVDIQLRTSFTYGLYMVYSLSDEKLYHGALSQLAYITKK